MLQGSLAGLAVLLGVASTRASVVLAAGGVGSTSENGVVVVVLTRLTELVDAVGVLHRSGVDDEGVELKKEKKKERERRRESEMRVRDALRHDS